MQEFDRAVLVRPDQNEACQLLRDGGNASFALSSRDISIVTSQGEAFQKSQRQNSWNPTLMRRGSPVFYLYTIIKDGVYLCTTNSHLCIIARTFFVLCIILDGWTANRG